MVARPQEGGQGLDVLLAVHSCVLRSVLACAACAQLWPCPLVAAASQEAVAILADAGSSRRQLEAALQALALLVEPIDLANGGWRA